MNALDLERYNNLLFRGGMDVKYYQYDGISWCLSMERNGILFDFGNKISWVRGGILADEMGLGKSFQLLCTMYCNMLRRTLIIVPLILLEQWRSLFVSLLGYDVLVYHGDVRGITLDVLSSKYFVLTTYGMMRKSSSILYSLSWCRVVFDEAHHLRNRSSCLYKCVKCLKSSIRWLITGTIVHNCLNDFYSLCGILGLPSVYYKRKCNMPYICRQFILRRTKKEVGLNLPCLNVNICNVSWGNDELFLSRIIHDRLSLSSDSLVCSSNILCELSTLTLFLKAKQLCIYPRMLDIFLNMNGLLSYKSVLFSSSKLDKVISMILERRDNKKKKLLFCHFRYEIDELYTRLIRLGFNVSVIDGRISKRLRNDILFDKTLDILILQIKTCCEGLNLQQFSDVYFVSPHWNPAIEDQAIARCHRIGQENNVEIFKFQMDDIKIPETDKNIHTIENYISMIQNKKRELSNDLFNVNDDKKE